MTALTRRTFLKNSLWFTSVTAGADLLERPVRAAPLGANERLRVAVMGVHGRGRNHIANFLARKDAEVVCLCEVDNNVVSPALQQVEKATGKTPLVLQDIRKVLEDKSIDVLSIATPNHWHALATFWACQAGKDVYVEKPLSQTYAEGRVITTAARKYGRIVQHGTQNRSSPSLRAAVEFMKAGKLGKVTLARAINFKQRNGIGRHTATVAVPSGVDYDLWVGPAPMQPLRRKQFHYDWHWFWDYGSGDMGNQGVHQIDVARFGLGKELPHSVLSVGGRFLYADDGETANTQLAVFDYGDCQLVVEVRNLASKPVEGVRTGNVFYGTEGIIIRDLGNGNECRAFLGKKREPVPLTDEKSDVAHCERIHFGNFLAAIRSRRAEQLYADVLEGHYSSGLCHLANISHRLGQETPFEPRTRTFAGNQEATELFQSMQDHLRDAGLKMDAARYRLGPKLMLDAKTERFRDQPEANALLTRTYRAPFVLPEKI
jgi:predicted dehydrogenase